MKYPKQVEVKTWAATIWIGRKVRATGEIVDADTLRQALQDYVDENPFWCFPDAYGVHIHAEQPNCKDGPDKDCNLRCGICKICRKVIRGAYWNGHFDAHWWEKERLRRGLPAR